MASTRSQWIGDICGIMMVYFCSRISLVNIGRSQATFSGSGSIGIEALSRGAESATFVDNSSEAYQVIKNNLQAVGEEQNVQNSDVISFLSQAKESYDIVFLDPPYHFENIAKLFELLHSGILKTNSVVVYESAADEKIEEFAAGFELIKEKKYGITKLFYFKEEEN